MQTVLELNSSFDSKRRMLRADSSVVTFVTSLPSTIEKMMNKRLGVSIRVFFDCYPLEKEWMEYCLTMRIDVLALNGVMMEEMKTTICNTSYKEE